MTDVFHSPHARIDIPDISLPELLLSRADTFGPKTALVDPTTGESLTFSEFASNVRGLAAGGLG